VKRSPMPRRRTTKRKPRANACVVRSKTHTGPARNLQGGPFYCAKHAEQRADRLFSLWVRDRDRRCTAAPVFHSPCVGGLQAAHIVGRRNKRVRFNPANVHAVCAGHHRAIDQHGQEDIKYRWALHVLGELQWIELSVKARQTADRHAAALTALAWLEKEPT
jgi:hypothetical protein